MTGFSVNPPAGESQFSVLEPTDLNMLFGGKDRYALADDPDSLKRVIDRARVGHELFPWIMCLILVVVTAESVLANRFYKETGQKAMLAEAK